ncbi:MAG: esterase family protein [Verrucomicrobia bacterium]|nr:esterase family protein [Verrucomicrobiota bacterium]
MLIRPLALAALLGSLTIPPVLAEDYKLGPDSQVQPGVPQGEVKKFTLADSKAFPGTSRDWWIYVPKQYDGKQPACVMFFCDGGGMVSPTGAYRVPVVFDNLIAKKETPVTIGVFINPGSFPSSEPGKAARSNRSFEYDALGDLNARFFIEEIAPLVAKDYRLTGDPAGWAICGNSSGGIAAFTVAWERPEKFGKVVSHIGSFTNIRGGHVYPSLIRKTLPENAKNFYPKEQTALLEGRRKLRVFLQDGASDLDNLHGNWPLAAQDMAAALKYAGWDYKFVFGTEGHNGKQGGAVFPDTMRWLWRDRVK